ncbi:ABC transporter ATP-binding protein [Streptosporangium canum]|uniref:ABC transporter ATP-binding protein n=1 Tax=Streptosporangium canum TaxID=324952 RepID=UPI0036AE9A9B
MPEPVIELTDVYREFPASPPVLALNKVTLTVHQGDHVAIVGPSGSGKSTLMNVLGLLDRPTRGSYKIRGVETITMKERQRTRLRGDAIGFVFQSFHLLAHRSVLDNVVLGEMYTAGGNRKGRKARALQALERVSLSHRVDFLPPLLSGGERQRVAIARALMGSPSLLLCDEPTGNLDSTNTEAVLNLLDELRSGQGLTVVVITHENEVAKRAARRVLIADGTLTEVA